MSTTRLTGIVAALATTAAILTTSAAGAGSAPAAAAAELPREIPNGLELTLAGGDTFRVWTSDNYKVVRSKRRDAATGEWGVPQVVLRSKNLFCGGLDARTAAGAVALTVECDRFGYAEDQAPTSSRALWSADTLTWASHRLPGEAYEEPGISPDGTNAVWPLYQGYVVRTPDGFSHRRLVAKRQEYGSTAVIDDNERVSLLYTPPAGPSRCALVALSPSPDGTVARQSLALPGPCGDVSLQNRDVNTVLVGDTARIEDTTVVQRTDAESRWAVTRLAPSLAPGLVLYSTTGADTQIVAATGLPLLALGSGNGRRWTVQTFDPSTQTWGPRSIAYDSGSRKCAWGETWADPPTTVIAADLRCGTRHVVLTTSDGLAWRALQLGKHPLGISPDGRFVAVPSRSQTHIISAGQGLVTLPGQVTGQCDVVVPVGPSAAILLTAAGRHKGWPTVLKRSGPDGWNSPSKTTLPTFSPTCGRAVQTFDDLPYRFGIHSRWKGYTVRIVQRGGIWTVRRSRS